MKDYYTMIGYEKVVDTFDVHTAPATAYQCYVRGEHGVVIFPTTDLWWIYDPGCFCDCAHHTGAVERHEVEDAGDPDEHIILYVAHSTCVRELYHLACQHVYGLDIANKLSGVL